MCGNKAHGARCVRVRLRGRSRAPPEPCVAQHIRDLAASRAGLHGRGGRHEGRLGAYQDTAICSTGILYFFYF